MLKTASIYLGYNTLCQLVGLVAMPFIVKSIAPATYGVLGYLIAFLNIAMIFAYFGMDYVIAAFYYDKEYETGSVKSQSMIVVLIVSLVVTIICYLARDSIYGFMMGENEGFRKALSIIIPCIFFRTVYRFILTIYRYAEKPWLYVLVSSLISFGQTACGIIVLYVWRESFENYLYSILIVDIIVFCISLGTIMKNIEFSLSYKLLKRMLRYGLPCVPAAVIYSVMVITDRYFIAHMLPLQDLGLYNVAMKITFALTFLISAFQLAFSPYVFKKYNSLGAKSFVHFEHIVNIGVMLGGLGVLALTAMSPVLIKYLTKPAYYGAQSIVGYMALSAFALLYNNMTDYGLAFKKISKYEVPFSLGTFVLNAALNYIFIINLGLVGAAIATAVTQIVRAFAICLVSAKLEGIRFFNFKKDILIVGILFLLVMFMSSISRSFVLTGYWSNIFYAGLAAGLVYVLIQYKTFYKSFREVWLFRRLGEVQ